MKYIKILGLAVVAVAAVMAFVAVPAATASLLQEHFCHSGSCHFLTGLKGFSSLASRGG